LEKFLQNSDQSASRKKFLYLIYSITGFLLLIIVFAGVGSFRSPIDQQLPDWLLQAIREDRKSLLRSDTFRSLIFILLFSATIWLLIKEKLKTAYVFILAGLLVTIDMFTVSKRYLNEKNYVNERSSNFLQSEADQIIVSQNTDNRRVLNLNNPFNESITSYYHHSIGGYHGAKLGRYQDLIENGISEEVQLLINNLQNNKRGFEEYNVLNMLNTGFIKFGGQANNVIVNPNANGNAWFVSEITRVNNAMEEINQTTILASKNSAVVDVSKFDFGPNKNYKSGTIELVEYSPNKLIYQSKNPGEGFAVFFEIYYPEGWNAYIDGNQVDIIRANYVLRALQIPVGNHEIVFEFKPKSYKYGSVIMIISSILILLMAFTYLAIFIKTSTSKN
jgi:hypothetical protein